MSGLTAGLALLRRGHNVTVLEYQARVGGRLLSVPLKNGQVSEAGGGHFRANMPLVLSYVRHFKLPLLSLSDGLPRYFIQGKQGSAADPADWPWPLSAEERGVSLTSSLNRCLWLAGFDTRSVLDPRWPDPETLARLDGLTMGGLLKSVGASDGFLTLLAAHGGTFINSAPALQIVPRLAYHFGDQNLFRVQGGNARLPQALADAIGSDRIVLNAQVASIDQTGSRVRVATRDGRMFAGDAIVSTIPFTMLDDIEVRPRWTAGKQRLFKALDWDKTVKVIVQTSAPSWLAKDIHGWPMVGGDRPWERVIDITGNEPGGSGNVFFYLNGSNADAVLKLDPAQRAESIVSQFRADMPDIFGDVIATQAFAWSEQPWIRASFGGVRVGEGWAVKEWAAPEGRIHLAGDFTSIKTGWVEGAIESGLRAARQIDPGARAEAEPRIDWIGAPASALVQR